MQQPRLRVIGVNSPTMDRERYDAFVDQEIARQKLHGIVDAPHFKR
jgi:hypothetical protein